MYKQGFFISHPINKRTQPYQVFNANPTMCEPMCELDALMCEPNALMCEPDALTRQPSTPQ